MAAAALFLLRTGRGLGGGRCYTMGRGVCAGGACIDMMMGTHKTATWVLLSVGCCSVVTP
eukprot:1158074-Pelagomonas_calceolata.AAC.1